MVPAFIFPKKKNPKSTVFQYISVKYCKLVCCNKAINLKHLKSPIDIARYGNDDPHCMS